MVFHRNITNSAIMKKRLRISLLLLCFGPVSVLAQPTLTLESFLDQVGKYHPVARQADFRIRKALGGLLSAKGIFDPEWQLTNESKTFDGSNYYRYTNSELKIFTPLGLKIKTGLENSSGTYLDPERTEGLLTYIGIEQPVLKGLLIDKKRAALKQARLFLKLSEIEKQNLLNDLFQESLASYWDWAGAYAEIKIVTENLENARDRFELMKILFANGDKSAADTLEADLQVTSLKMDLAQIQQDYLVSAFRLSAFLWDENDEPLLLADSTIPDPGLFNNLPPLISQDSILQFLASHPEIRKYEMKLQSLEIEKKLKKQDLLPELTLRGNILSRDYYRIGKPLSPYLENNYKVGLSVSIPFFLRRERGALKQTHWKIRETQSQLDQKSWELVTKIRQYETELVNQKNQIQLAEQLTKNSGHLLELEELRFQQGESSLFIVNSRQNKQIESQVKLLKAKIKYVQTWWKQQWAAGVLYQ